MRIEHLRQIMARKNLAGLLVTRPENLRYLSGRSDWEGVMIITAEHQAIATDSRYYEVVRTHFPDWELIEAGYDFDNMLLDTLLKLNLADSQVGFEASHLSVDRFLRWQSAVTGRLSLATTIGLVEEMRQIKDDSELDAIRQAVSLTDQALSHIFDWMRPGKTEREVAWKLERFMREMGSPAAAFDIIVGAGPSGALPHAVPGDRPIQQGEPIVIDLGCVIDDYRSDLTRTVCLGEPADERYLEIWNLVLKAQQAAVAGLRAGMIGVEGDKLARDVIETAGYGQSFGHSLGHGVGLAIHEEPRLSFRNPDQLPAGAVVTIEPGIYIPGWGGVRLEDMVVIRADSAEILATSEKIPVIPC